MKASEAEDFGYMLDDYRCAVIMKERLTDAKRSILGVKAALGLHRLQKEGKLTPPEESLAVVGCAEHLAMADDGADKCISPVKDIMSMSGARSGKLGDRLCHRDKFCSFLEVWGCPMLQFG